MSKREKMIGMFMIVMIGVSAVLYLSGGKKKGAVLPAVENSAGTSATPAKAAGAGAADTAESPEAFNLKEVAEIIALYHAESDITLDRDPFQELVPNVTELSFSDLVLEGVHWEIEEPVAIINQQILKEGDEISGFVVDEIKEDEVILFKDKRWHILKFTQ